MENGRGTAVIEVRLLGVVQLHVDGERVDLRGPRQQRLLAFLGLNRDRVVGFDRLAEAVWPDGDFPTDPRATLWTYVSRLRRSLGSADALERLDNGYVLRGDGVTVDAATFEEVARPNPSAAPSQRADALERVLSSWRGPALDGFEAEPWAQADAVRLNELRIAAVEERAACLIDSGQLQQAIVELESATADHPTRESTHLLLMRALDGAGRRGEALRVFNLYARRLSTELGLQPGEAIAEVERNIHAAESAAHDPRQVRGYELGERIGDGAFAVVYKATQPSVGRTVAVKQIRAELANRPAFIRRFEAEAHLVARLEHPRIVPLYDYWREPGSAFLVMRWLRGGSLADELLGGPLPVDRATQIMLDVGDATAAAHRAGVVHRDLKPENVLLDEEGRAYLTDFGIALSTSEGPDPDAALSIGSPAYASPEQLRHELVGPTSDVWGLGITFYEALTGQLPFAGAMSRAELLDAQLHQPVPSVRAVRADVSPEVDALIARATSKDPSHRFPTAAEFVDAVRGLDLPAEKRSAARGGRTAIALAENPYKGLRAFDEADAADFYGRERLVDEILTRFSEPGPDGRFHLLVGPSGAGKSSVVRAGLLPALRRGEVPGSDNWFFTTMTPGSQPFEELEAALLRVAINPPASLLEQVRSDERGVLRSVRRVLPDDDSELVLVIDQLEELFTMCEDATERAAFAEAISTAVNDAGSRLRVVATLRADFYDKPLAHHGFSRLARENTVPVAALAPDELEHCIVDPALSAGCEFEPGLVALMVADVADQPGALPLLQYTLTRLYEQQVSGLFTLDAYRRLGGIAGSIASRAEELYLEGDDSYQKAVRAVFSRLVTLGRGREDTRRRSAMSELGSAGDVAAVVEDYGVARLLSFDRDDETREPTVEVAHEALIRDWPRLGTWLDEDREVLVAQHAVTAAASSWVDGGRDHADLYRGGRLETIEEFGPALEGRLNDAELEFVQASRTQRDDEEQQRRRRLARLRVLLATTAVIAAVALIAGVVAFVQQREAEDQRNLATAAAAEAEEQRARAEEIRIDADLRRMAAQAPTLVNTNRPLALLLAAESAAVRESSVTLGALQRTVVALPRGWLGSIDAGMDLSSVALADDGSRVAVGGTAGVRVYDTTARNLLFSLDADSVTSVGLSATGDVVIYGDEGGGWSVVSVTSGEVVVAGLIEDASARARSVSAISMAPSARRAAVGGSDGSVVVVDVGQASSEVVGSINGRVGSIEWNDSESRVIASGGESVAARVFDASGGQIGPDFIVDSALEAGSTDAGFIGEDVFIVHGSVVRFDAETGAELGRVDGVDTRSTGWARATSASTVLVLDQNESYIADLETGVATPLDLEFRAPVELTMTASGLFAQISRSTVEFGSASGDRVLATATPRLRTERLVGSVSDDGRLVTSGFGTGYEVWRSGAEPFRLMQGSDLYVRFRQNTLWLADLVNGFRLWTESGGFEGPYEQRGVISNYGLSPDGRLIVLPLRLDLGEEGSDYEVEVIDRSTGRVVRVLTDLDDAMPASAELFDRFPSDVEFNHDGSRLFVSTFAGNWAVWDTSTWEVVTGPVFDDPISDVDFAGSGGEVAAAFRGFVSIRDADDLLTTLRGPVEVDSSTSSGGRSVRFSADETHIVTSGLSGASLMDASTLERIGTPFPNDSIPQGAELAQESNEVMTIVGDDVLLWNVNVDEWRDIACVTAGRNMTPAEWEEFGPIDEPYRATCPQWPPLA